MSSSSFRQHKAAFVADPVRARTENEIAAAIQSTILPGEIDIEGLEISAGMIPADDVGGDYYDIIPAKDGCWIAIGDVAGHGLGAGLIALMIQSALMGMINIAPNASPRELLSALNGVLFENIRKRMNRDEHVTMSLLRYHADGSVVFAGAHEDMILCRVDGSVEMVATEGTWLGAVKAVDKAMIDATLQLGPGDLLLLHTDGLVEAPNGEGARFGIERLMELVKTHRNEGAAVVRSEIMSALQSWTNKPDDDVTVVAVRCRGVYWSG